MQPRQVLYNEVKVDIVEAAEVWRARAEELEVTVGDYVMVMAYVLMTLVAHLLRHQGTKRSVFGQLAVKIFDEAAEWEKQNMPTGPMQ